MSFVERLHQQLAADEATWRALQDAGDRSSARRAIEYQLTCATEDNLGALGYLLEQMGVGEAQLVESGDGFALQVSVQSPAEWSEIAKTSLLMKCLATAFQVEYQGWGSSVVSG